MSMNDKPTGRRGSRQSNVQLPWSDKGWYTDKQRANRDADLDKKIAEAGGGLTPAGYMEDRPGLAVTPGFHNPYLNFILTPFATWFFFFITDKLRDTPPLMIGLGIFFGLGVVVPFLMSAIRVPSWHRGRKAAREHIAEHGGAFPPELRWYT